MMKMIQGEFNVTKPINMKDLINLLAQIANESQEKNLIIRLSSSKNSSIKCPYLFNTVLEKPFFSIENNRAYNFTYKLYDEGHSELVTEKIEAFKSKK